MAINTTALIATHVINTMPTLPTGVSGAMMDIVEMAKSDVENYTGDSIDSNNVDSAYRSAIISFAKAHVVDHLQTHGNGTSQSIEGLSIGDYNLGLTAQDFRNEALEKLKFIGRHVKFDRSLS